MANNNNKKWGWGWGWLYILKSKFVYKCLVLALEIQQVGFLNLPSLQPTAMTLLLTCLKVMLTTGAINHQLSNRKKLTIDLSRNTGIIMLWIMKQYKLSQVIDIEIIPYFLQMDYQPFISAQRPSWSKAGSWAEWVMVAMACHSNTNNSIGNQFIESPAISAMNCSRSPTLEFSQTSSRAPCTLVADAPVDTVAIRTSTPRGLPDTGPGANEHEPIESDSLGTTKMQGETKTCCLYSINAKNWK